MRSEIESADLAGNIIIESEEPVATADVCAWPSFDYSCGIPDLEVYETEQTPEAFKFCLPPLFIPQILGGKKRMRFWQMGFDPFDSTGPCVRTRYGLTDGKHTPAMRAITVNSSGRNLLRQAILQLKSDYNDKMHEGYSWSGIVSTSKRQIKVALAKVYGPPDKPGASRLNFTKGVAIQPKLDGVRHLVFVDTNTSVGRLVQLSRKNRPRESMTILETELKRLFEHPELVGMCLDGELFVKGLGMNRIASIVSSVSKIHKDIGDIRYHIFDLACDSQLSFIDRYNILRRAFHSYQTKYGEPVYLKLVPCYALQNHEEIWVATQAFLADGYEGGVVRKLDASYKGSRSCNLLKVKIFVDEEAAIIGIEDGEGREKGLAIWRVRDIRGNEFRVRPRGTHEKRKEWFDYPAGLIGKQATIRYFELTEYNIPRFPVGICIRDYD